jgi:hypothetical protein
MSGRGCVSWADLCKCTGSPPGAGNARPADAERLGDIRSADTLRFHLAHHGHVYIDGAGPCRRWQAVSCLPVERHPARGSGEHQSRDEQGQSVSQVRRYWGRAVQGIGDYTQKLADILKVIENNVPSDAMIRNRRLVDTTKKVQ